MGTVVNTEPKKPGVLNIGDAVVWGTKKAVDENVYGRIVGFDGGVVVFCTPRGSIYRMGFIWLRHLRTDGERERLRFCEGLESKDGRLWYDGHLKTEVVGSSTAPSQATRMEIGCACEVAA